MQQRRLRVPRASDMEPERKRPRVVQSWRRPPKPVRTKEQLVTDAIQEWLELQESRPSIPLDFVGVVIDHTAHISPDEQWAFVQLVPEDHHYRCREWLPNGAAVSCDQLLLFDVPELLKAHEKHKKKEASARECSSSSSSSSEADEEDEEKDKKEETGFATFEPEASESFPCVLGSGWQADEPSTLKIRINTDDEHILPCYKDFAGKALLPTVSIWVSTKEQRSALFDILLEQLSKVKDVTGVILEYANAAEHQRFKASEWNQLISHVAADMRLVLQHEKEEEKDEDDYVFSLS